MGQEAMIPPWVRPESPETIRWIDDATIAFPPAFGRGTTQRGIWADPRWGLRRRYRGLRTDEKAAILNALSETRGQFNVLRVTPHTPIRGSFSTSELLSNNTFANGTTGWESQGNHALSVSDRVMRCTRSASTGAINQVLRNTSAVTTTQYAPYVARAAIAKIGGASQMYLQVGTGGGAGGFFSSPSTEKSLRSLAFVSLATTAQVQVVDNTTSGVVAGDLVEVPYISLARCALVDLGANLLLRTEELDNAAWQASTGGGLTVSANATTSPDGATSAESLIESVGGTFHGITPAASITIASTALEYSFSVALKAGARTWAQLILREATGSTDLSAFFNLSTGAVGTTAAGTNWSNIRTFSVDAGNGWYICTIVGKKTNAATSLMPFVMLATGNGTVNYSGNGTSNIYAWRPTLAQASVPGRLIATTSSATTGSPPTSGAMYTKGWPASTNGLLLTGDWFEINGELKQLTAPVNSDAAGLALMQYRPGIAGTPADSDPIIVFEPFGRFIYPQGTHELENLFGVYGDCEMNLEEVYV